MEKGNLAKWLKKEGDSVKSGDVIAEIETDKATMKWRPLTRASSPKIVVPEGSQDVPVNQLIAVLAARARMSPQAAASAAPAAPSRRGARSGCGPAAAPAAAPAPVAAPAAAPAPGTAPVAAAPTVAACSLAAGPSPREGEGHRSRGAGGSGPRGRIIARDVEGAKPGAAPAAAAAARPLLRPALPKAAAAAAPAVSGPTADQVKALFRRGHL